LKIGVCDHWRLSGQATPVSVPNTLDVQAATNVSIQVYVSLNVAVGKKFAGEFSQMPPLAVGMNPTLCSELDLLPVAYLCKVAPMAKF